MKKMILAGFAALLVLTGCSISEDDLADPSFQTLQYAGGFGAGSKFKRCVPVGEKLVSDDKFYRYPTTQRELVYDTEHYVDKNGDGVSEGSADHKDLLVNVNGVNMYVKMKIQFFLNTDCDPIEVAGKKYEGGVIQVFHEKMGKTRNAYFNADGTYNNGWIWMMDNYISSSATELTVPAVRKFTPEKAWQDTTAWTDIAATVEKDIQSKVDGAMETDLQFYKNLRVKVFSVSPDDDFVTLYKDRQTAETRAATAEANQKAQVSEANAKAAVAAAQASVKRAEISGYGGFDNWNKAQAVEKGMNPYQPTYVVGGTSVK